MAMSPRFESAVPCSPVLPLPSPHVPSLQGKVKFPRKRAKSNSPPIEDRVTSNVGIQSASPQASIKLRIVSSIAEICCQVQGSGDAWGVSSLRYSSTPWTEYLQGRSMYLKSSSVCKRGSTRAPWLLTIDRGRRIAAVLLKQMRDSLEETLRNRRQALIARLAYAQATARGNSPLRRRWVPYTKRTRYDDDKGPGARCLGGWEGWLAWEHRCWYRWILIGTLSTLWRGWSRVT